MTASAAMPPRAPLPFEPQNLRAAIAGETRRTGSGAGAWRALVFSITALATGALVALLSGHFAKSGLSGAEAALIAVMCVTFAWIVLSVATITAALLNRVVHADMPVRERTGTDAPPIRTALLVPIRNEDPAAVFGNAAAMLDDLVRVPGDNTFALFVLSDTQDGAIAEAEWRALLWLRATAPASVGVFYRRRAENTDKKSGNLADWIRGWGAAYDAMLVLDADSLMTGRAIRVLAEALRADPAVGLIQSFPGLIGAETLFGRVQQFSNATYSWLAAEGLALWTRDEGNYWGHNAILRTRAFAASAGLPPLRNRKGAPETILSHDFVEAGLLRRQGWAVRFMGVPGSYEETPATLLGYILRDRRWCAGNLQHLRLLHTRGLHPVSRFHLFYGAMSYLMAPAWLLLLAAWALVGLGRIVPDGYFSDGNPLYPVWPELGTTEAVAVLLFLYGMLVLPKLAAGTMIAADSAVRRRFGGGWALWGGVVLELAVSIVYAPILMVQQSLAVGRASAGLSTGWAPQSRSATAVPIADLIRFHRVETALGLLLTAGLATGAVSVWLAPIALSLALAVPLSALSAVRVDRLRPRTLRFESPQSLAPPAIWRNAQRARADVAAYLATQAPVAAE